MCIYSVTQQKKRENVKKIQFFANDIRVWHLQFKSLLETGEAKTCKLDQYAYRSCWDISLRDFNQKFMEVKFKMSHHDKRYRSEEISPTMGNIIWKSKFRSSVLIFQFCMRFIDRVRYSFYSVFALFLSVDVVWFQINIWIGKSFFPLHKWHLLRWKWGDIQILSPTLPLKLNILQVV